MEKSSKPWWIGTGVAGAPWQWREKKCLLMTTNIKLWNRITKPFWLNNVEYFPEIQWILNGSHWQNWAVLDDSTSHIPLKSGSGAAFCTSLPCSSLHWVQLEDSPRFTGIKPKWSISKSQLPKCEADVQPVVARCGTELQHFGSWGVDFDVFQAKSPSSAVHSGFLRPPKEMLPTKSSPPHSLRKWWEIYWATPCADCTIDTKNHLDRIHLKSWLSFVASSQAFPKQHENMMRGISSKSSIKTTPIHIIHTPFVDTPRKVSPICWVGLTFRRNWQRDYPAW